MIYNGKFIDFLDGLMLGDGSIAYTLVKNKYKIYRYIQGCIYLDWLDYIKDCFFINGINTNINDVSNHGYISNNKKYNITTSNFSGKNDFFFNQHKRWYIKDYNIDEYPTRRWHLDKKTEEYFAWHKTVPKDICLTPQCVANWFMGDGSFNGTQIQLSTDSFTVDEVNYLSSILHSNKISNCYVGKSSLNKPIIFIGKKDETQHFLDYVKPHIFSCYSYKLKEE